MFKLALNAGHGLHTAGKRCLKSLDPNETREWYLNDRIADKIEKLLATYEGIEVLRIDDTTGAKDIGLTTRTNNANKWGADFYLAIHHNAGVNGGTGGGIQAYVYTKSSQASIDWQKELYNELIALTGLKGNRSDGMPKANLHEVRETNMPAVLLELGFMDSSTDVPIILSEDFANKCAQACVNVLVRKANLIKKVTEPKVEPKPQPKPQNESKTEPSKNTLVLEWQKAAIADGFKFPKYGADGKWGSECEAVAKKAVCKKHTIGFKYRNLTKIVQKAVGVTADGKFGNDTRNAVIAYQKKNGLTPDGCVGLNTWKKILGIK